jgi:hypothetical protein
VSRNSHSLAGYTISDPSHDYGHLYWALVVKISTRDELVRPYSCPRRDEHVGPRKNVVRTGGWELCRYHYLDRGHRDNHADTCLRTYLNTIHLSRMTCSTKLSRSSHIALIITTKLHTIKLDKSLNTMIPHLANIIRFDKQRDEY